MWVGYKVVAGLGLLTLGACGEDPCEKARVVEDAIAKNAEEVDQISSAGICTLSESEVANRLMAEGGSVYANMATAQARAKEYVANCNKLRELKTECGD